MFKHYCMAALLLVIVNAQPLLGNTPPSYPPYPTSYPQTTNMNFLPTHYPAERYWSGREEMAYVDNGGYASPKQRKLRHGDWSYHENWRYDRDAFYSGETQPQYYREHHPYGPPGVGYDGDDNYLRYRNYQYYNDYYSHYPHNGDRYHYYANAYPYSNYRTSRHNIDENDLEYRDHRDYYGGPSYFDHSTSGVPLLQDDFAYRPAQHRNR